MKEIPLTQGQFAIVDDCDYDWLSEYKWCASKTRGVTYYAITSLWRGDRLVLERMHRLIMGFPPCEVDHRNRNGLDNQRENLRLATHKQNTYNVGPYGKHSNFKGVTLVRGQYYVASIRAEGHRFHLGCFASELKAAEVYDAAASRIHKEFAYLNFPDRPTGFMNKHIERLLKFVERQSATKPKAAPLIAYKKQIA